MKKSMILIATLLSLVGCSANPVNSASNINNPSTKSTSSSSSGREYIYVDALKANNLAEEDKIANATAQVDTFHGPLFDGEYNRQNIFIIKNAEEANNFKSLLRDNEAFGDLATLPYESINYFVSGTLGCTSTAFSYTFKGLYLKNNTVYAHLEYDDRLEDGVGVDTAMRYQYCHFTLNKSVSFTDAKIIISHYE